MMPFLNYQMRCAAFVFLFCLTSFSGFGQTLNLPARSANAPTGTEFVNIITSLSRDDRENVIYTQIAAGNVPNWMRTMVLISTNLVISGTNHTVSYYVTPDYLAVGTDQDYFLEPMTPLLGQRLANLLNCSMPTRKMVNDIWSKAPCKLSPSPISPSAAMITVPVFNNHNSMVRTQRNAVVATYPLGTLVGGDKKDVVLSNKIYTNFASSSITKPVVIYGWHYTSGSPIQPLYNGHEETYADYSHGIRMVQMNITVDGAPNTVTNILTSATLSALLSDEGVIAIPRYTIAQTGPKITVQPYSQTLNVGSNVTFSVVATGTAPLRYQWLFNANTITNATNSTYSITNLQSTNSGKYSVRVSNADGSTESIPAILSVNTTSYPVLFSETFETNNSANWNIFWGAGNAVSDYTVDWSFNYGTNVYTFNGTSYLIPPAPNSKGTTRGVKFTVNNNDASAVIAGVNIYPKNKTFTNNYVLKFDVWINYPGANGGTGTGVAGSTEHAIFGINHLGTQVNWAATTATSSDGVWFGMDGEGGTSFDYSSYIGNLSGTQIQLTSPTTSGIAQSNNTVGIYPALFPASRFETPGSPGKNWVAAEISQINGVLTWKLDGTILTQRTNTSVFKSGNIMLGFMDTFPSIAAPAKDAFVVFDNVRVEDLTGVTLQAPAINTAPQDQTSNAGADVIFSVVANGSAPLKYQWKFNNVPLNGQTNQTLTLSNVQEANTGDYSVVVTNAAGAVSSTASLTVISTSSRFEGITKNGNNQIELSFTGVEGVQYAIDASTNLVQWEQISILSAENTALSFTDTASTNFEKRFYRARNLSD